MTGPTTSDGTSVAPVMLTPKPRNRRQRSTTTSSVIVGQAIAGLALNRSRVTAALFGFSAAVAVMVVSWHAAYGDDPYTVDLVGGGWLAGTMLLAVVAAATAGAPDPRQLRATAVLDLLGTRRRHRLAIVAVEAMLLALAAVVLGWVVGIAITAVTDVGNVSPSVAGASLVLVATDALILVPLVALAVGWRRTNLSVLSARGAPLPVRRGLFATRTWIALRLASGAALLAAGYWLATTFRSWTDLDLLLWPTMFLAVCGLALLVTTLLAAVINGLAKAPTVAPNLSAALLRSRRAMLLPSMILGMVAAFALAVHAVLGAGLDQREEDRRRDVSERYEMVSALEPNQVVVGRAESENDVVISGELPSDSLDAVKAEVPGASVAPIYYRNEAIVTGDPLVPRPTSGRVADATPELLAALDLDHLAPDVADGKAIALDPSVVSDGRIELLPRADRIFPELLDTVTVDERRLPVHLPAALLPPDKSLFGGEYSWLEEDPAAHAPNSLIVRLPEAATDQDAAEIRESVSQADDYPIARVRTWYGTEALSMPFDDYGRLDASGAIGLRQPAEVHLAMGLLALLALTGLLVATRLATVTRRADEDVIELAGAPPSVLRRIAAYQLCILTTLATTVGLAVGVGLTRLAIQAYNSDGRFWSGPHGAHLPPIPLLIPSGVWWALVLIPLGAVVISSAFAARRGPESRAAVLADGVVW